MVSSVIHFTVAEWRVVRGPRSEVWRFPTFNVVNTNQADAWSVTACLHIVDHRSEVLVASPGICRRDAVWWLPSMGCKLDS